MGDTPIEEHTVYFLAWSWQHWLCKFDIVDDRYWVHDYPSWLLSLKYLFFMLTNNWFDITILSKTINNKKII